jgi:tRNA A-37 threonylcarbamoyl transferase component Bud32
LTVLGDRNDIIEAIGAGTAANVFRVRDRRTAVVRAAKVLGAETAQTPGTVTRFEDEYRILRTLHHPHLPEVYDYGRTDEGGRFLVMELVDGDPLDAYFREHPRDLWLILYQLTEVLTFIHNHNLLHQDIKPSNILVKRTSAFGDEMPLVKVLDFGLTFRRDAGMSVQMVGTPAYMAPEVIRGESPLTRAVDHYSLGVSLYELLMGRVPFAGSVQEVLRAHLATFPQIEDELEWAELYPHLRGLLAKPSRDRLASFEELRRAVVTRLTGGVPALDRAYGAARIESVGMVGKQHAWRAFMDATLSGKEAADIALAGQPMSGRSHFLEAARAEWNIRGVASWQLGTDSDAAWLMDRPVDSNAPPSEKEFERAWQRVETRARYSATWIVAGGELSADELRLLEYFETGRTLAGPEVRANLGFVFAANSDSPENAIVFSLPTLSSHDIDSVVDHFRGEMLRTADFKELRRLLVEARESGELMRLLRRLIARGGLFFEAQRWRMDIDNARTIASEPAADGGRLVLPLTDAQQQVMLSLAIHPGAVPVRWIPAIAQLNDRDVVSALHDLRLRHLLEPVDLDGTPAVRITSRTVEQAVMRDQDAATLTDIHARYVERMTKNAILPERTHMRMLALHQEGSGDERSAYITRRHLFKKLWTTRSYGEIEQICRDAMSREGIRYGLARAYLRELINVLWAQNLTVRAYKEIDRFVS